MARVQNFGGNEVYFHFPEGATPVADISDLRLPWVHTLHDLNRVEAENISHAQRKYLKTPMPPLSSWFYFKELRAIHRAMFGKVWGWAGKPRTSITSIGVQPGLIPMRMAELCTEVLSVTV
jgi:fido (protein-threonine AMPylation protein)